jgi:hypothetical protein
MKKDSIFLKIAERSFSWLVAGAALTALYLICVTARLRF